MWDEIAAEVAREFPDVTWDKMLVDAMTMRMTLKPQTIDTVVATNLHADILSDLAAALAGSLGIAPTANLNPEKAFPSMFEPIHGSAFDIMGKGIANPIGTFWSAVMMLQHLGEGAGAKRLMTAIERVTADARFHTPDLGGKARTTEVTAAAGQSFRESLLFTHRGLSGPAILQASSYWRHGETVEIDLLPGLDFAAQLAEARAAGARAEARTLLARHLPRRLAERWCELYAAVKPVAAWSDREVAAFSAALHTWRFQPAGTEGYEKAEVTGGGVDTAALSSQTMEARKVPGLFFIGEVVDVTGHLGGFNFQWAWASGAAAGRAL